MVKMTNILVSSPGIYNHLTFLPYIYGILKSSCDQNEFLRNHLSWLKPIYLADSPEIIIEKYYKEHGSIDILAFSCYQWNEWFSLELAKLAKERNPKCMIIFGGPQPNWSNEDIFLQNPYIDVIVKGDAEDVFPKIIHDLIIGKEDFFNLNGLIINNHGVRIETSGQNRYALNNDKSSWIDQEITYKEIISECQTNNKIPWVMWETNRGCPYSCSFCDWGSATMSKIRKRDEKILYEEAMWFGKNKIPDIYFIDANFGIFSRDLDIIDYVIEAKEKYGYPKQVCFSLAKNNPERVFEVIKKCHDNGLIKYSIIIDFQTTDSNVLDAMNRSNIKKEKYEQLTQEILNYRLPLGATLIVGNPNDTVETFKKSVCDIIELGIHDELKVSNWCQLPNAPSSRTRFISMYKIKTIKRRTIIWRTQAKDARNNLYDYNNYIVECSSFSRDDWVEFMVFHSFVRALHYFSLTKFIAIFLRFTYNIGYLEFYDFLYQKMQNNQHLKSLRSHFYNWLEHDDSLLSLEFTKTLSMRLESDEWTFFKFISKLDTFYDDIFEVVSKNYQQVDIETLTDLFKYQKNLIITPDYDFKKGRIFSCKYDWQEYFDKTMYISKPNYKNPPKKQKVKYLTHQEMIGFKGQTMLNFQDQSNLLDTYITKLVASAGNRGYRTWFSDIKKI